METQFLTGTSRPRLLDDTGIRFAIGTGLVVVTLFIAGLAGLGAAPSACAVVLVAGIASGRLPVRIAGALGVIAWAFFTGFFENAYGQLTFARGDLLRLAAFAVATVVVAAACGAVVSAGSAARHG